MIDASGRIVSPDECASNLARYLVVRDDGWAIRYYRDAQSELVLTQSDLRNFQLAKGAIRAGLEVLLERVGMTAEEVSQALITGALGASLSLSVLKRVALLPEPMLDKTRFVKNGVLSGLGAYLSHADRHDRLSALLASLQPFPLSGSPAFEKRFLAALNF